MLFQLTKFVPLLLKSDTNLTYCRFSITYIFWTKLHLSFRSQNNGFFDYDQADETDSKWICRANCENQERNGRNKEKIVKQNELKCLKENQTRTVREPSWTSLKQVEPSRNNKQRHVEWLNHTRERVKWMNMSVCHLLIHSNWPEQKPEMRMS